MCYKNNSYSSHTKKVVFFFPFERSGKFQERGEAIEKIKVEKKISNLNLENNSLNDVSLRTENTV